MFALSLPLQISFLMNHSNTGDKTMTESPSVVEAVAEQQLFEPPWSRGQGLCRDRELPWILLPGRSVLGVSDETDRTSSSWLRTEFIQRQVSVITGALNSFVFMLHPLFPAESHRGRSKSLYLVQVLPIFCKAGCS